MLQVPDGSIYFWMYTEGLKHTPIEDIQAACSAAGVDIRPKDMQNWVNGWMRSDRTTGERPVSMGGKNNFERNLFDYPENPSMAIGERTDCWVPCNAENKPLIKWSNGCMQKEDAIAYKNCVYLGQNMLDQHKIVIDCDGDHGGQLNFDVIRWGHKYPTETHMLAKPKRLIEYGVELPDDVDPMWSASFHLTFFTDRWIPTQHFPAAHLDIVGNRNNSMRYWKNKVWNRLAPLQLTQEIWDDIYNYVERMKRDGE